MAPTICIAEFPMAGTTVNTYVRRRQRPQIAASVRRRTFALEHMLRSVLIAERSLTSHQNCPRDLEYTIPNRSISDTKLQAKVESCKKFIAARRDLLNIVVRTITLVQRNRILQRRVNALHAETRRYLCSTLNDPKNRCQERTLQAPLSEDENVLPFTQKQAVSTSSPSPSSDPIDKHSHHGFAYTCNHNDDYNRTDDYCSFDDNSEGSSRNGY